MVFGVREALKCPMGKLAVLAALATVFISVVVPFYPTFARKDERREFAVCVDGMASVVSYASHAGVVSDKKATSGWYDENGKLVADSAFSTIWGKFYRHRSNLVRSIGYEAKSWRYGFGGWTLIDTGMPSYKVPEKLMLMHSRLRDLAKRIGEPVTAQDKADYEKIMQDFDDSIIADLVLQNSYTERYRRGSEYQEVMNEADSFMSGGQYTEYFKTLERVLKAAVSCYQPIELASALNNKSWDLCTNPEKEVRNGKLALRFAKIAVEITRRAAVQDQRTLAMYTDTLAAAYAEDGDFENAVKFQQEAVDIATTVLAYHLQEYRDRLELFKKKEPYREEDDKEEQEVW